MGTATGSGAVPPPGVAGLALAVVAGTVFVVARAAATIGSNGWPIPRAPPPLLDDADWSIVSVYADGPDRISQIYDATEPAAEPPQLVLNISPRPGVSGPDTACQEYAVLVIDNPPADSCTSAGDNVWTIGQGSATSYVAVTEDVVVRVSLLYPGQVTVGRPPASSSS